MNKQAIEGGLVAIEVNNGDHAVRFTYLPDVDLEIDAITAYVEDMCDGQSNDIMIFTGFDLIKYLHRKDGVWTDIANNVKNGI
jgi:hypothetical protein